MLRSLKKHLDMWQESDLAPTLKELAIAVLHRAAQGMDDQGICRYLDFRKRGLERDSAEWKMIERTKEAVNREGSRLRQGICEIREELQLIEEAREREEPEERGNVESGEVTTDEVLWAWRDEIRYKNSLIPPGARKGRRSGRRRKREIPRSRYRRYYVEEAIRYDEEMRRKKKMQADS